MSKRYAVLILLGLGLLTHFSFFGHPNATVFDEVHFGKFVSGYYTHEYFFDIHPPLGKLAIAGFAKIFDFKPEFAFAEIGDKFPDKQYLILRLLPNLTGSLLPLVIFLLLLEMGFSRIASFFGGLLIVLENALLAQSHYILLDSFLLVFGFLALLFYFKYRNSKPLIPNTKYLVLFGIFSGLALSVKWTGLGFLALPLAIETFDIFKEKNYKNIAKAIIIPGITAFVIYFVLFAGHLTLLNKSGPGDAFMSVSFQKTLTGNPHNNDTISTPNILQKFAQLNMEMYKANQRLNATHPYSSPWYSWPAMTRPIYYWVEGNSRIYLLGNPIIWWLSSIAVLLSITYCLLRIYNSQFITRNSTILFLLAGYAVNMLPFVGVHRVMFLYHYFIAYIFAIMMLVWLIDKYSSTSISANKNSKIIFGVILGISAVTFIYFAPLTYGLNLSPKEYEARTWLESWK